MARPHVPKFGDWGAGGDAYPYTVCFDKARKGRAGEKSEKPNNPQETPNLPPSPFQPPQPRARPHTHREQHKPRPNNNSDHHRQSGSSHSSKNGHNRRTRPQSIGGNFTSHGHGQSPPAAAELPFRVKNSGNKDTASSGKGSSYDKDRNNAKANRVRHSSMGDEQHGRVGVALPKFGQWDMNPTGSDGGYTQVFNLVREEKKNTAKSPLHLQVDQSHHNSGRRKTTGGMVTCCFPWSKR